MITQPQHTEEETVADKGQKSLLVTRTVVQVVYSCYTTKRDLNLNESENKKGILSSNGEQSDPFNPSQSESCTRT